MWMGNEMRKVSVKVCYWFVVFWGEEKGNFRLSSGKVVLVMWVVGMMMEWGELGMWFWFLLVLVLLLGW